MNTQIRDMEFQMAEEQKLKEKTASNWALTVNNKNKTYIFIFIFNYYYSYRGLQSICQEIQSPISKQI